jgi:uridine nucleosidase
MIPLNVTHTCIFTSEINKRLLSGLNRSQEDLSKAESDPTATQGQIPPPATKLRHTLSTLILFFAATYKSTFGFTNGPPLHDALTIAYVCQPEIFKTTRYRVDVELTGTHTVGETVVDLWNYRGLGEEGWGQDSKNCLVAESVDVRMVLYLRTLSDS